MKIIEGALRAVHVPRRGDAGSIVLFHGFGANAMDLAPLSSIAPEFDWYFPEGPLQLGRGSFAWCPVVAEEQARLRALGQHVEFEDVTPPGLADARQLALNFAADLGLDKVILGGFSQGAMLAVDAALRSSLARGLVILSGSLISQDEWKSLAAGRKDRFFQSHGTFDTVLPFVRAKKLEGILKGAGMQGELIAFPGGHEITSGVAGAMADYLRSL